MGYEIEGNWFSLPKRWADMPSAYEAKGIAPAGGILTYNKGLLKKTLEQWNVVEPGASNDAYLVLNALRKPN